jgi:DNA (cytosine-5)-methyltransferase 1
MTRPRLLDLFCGAGGAAVGYHRAGFTVIGIDNRPQPHYPFSFYQGDATDGDFIASIGPFDAIHASPPCQAFSIATQRTRSNHDDLLTPTRAMLERTGLPWVIENVPGAPMRADLKLCGCMFGLPRLVRERWFEASWRPFQMRPPCHHPAPPITITVKGQPNRTGTALEAIAAMGIDWMTSRERGLAIPPAYTEYIGAQLMEHLKAAAA